jgi:hypothetical protein
MADNTKGYDNMTDEEKAIADQKKTNPNFKTDSKLNSDANAKGGRPNRTNP